MASVVEGEDFEGIRAWFERLAEHVRRVDFAGARPLFADDMIAFGTFTDFVTERDTVEAQQWRKVWPFIADFRVRPGSVRALVSPDRLWATGLALWDSTGFHKDGTPFERPGRVTIGFARARIGGAWVARHSHFSLCRGVPERSWGRTP